MYQIYCSRVLRGTYYCTTPFAEHVPYLVLRSISLAPPYTNLTPLGYCKTTNCRYLSVWRLLSSEHGVWHEVVVAKLSPELLGRIPRSKYVENIQEGELGGESENAIGEGANAQLC